MASPRRSSVVAREPVITLAAVASVIVALAAVFHVVLDVGTVEGILVSLVPIVTALFQRAKVTPVA